MVPDNGIPVNCLTIGEIPYTQLIPTDKMLPLILKQLNDKSDALGHSKHAGLYIIQVDWGAGRL